MNNSVAIIETWVCGLTIKWKKHFVNTVKVESVSLMREKQASYGTNAEDINKTFSIRSKWGMENN